jgi:uncharacterized membrane protein YeiB
MGHFIIGLILAHMDEQKILEAMTLSKRKRLLNIVICLVLFIFFLHSPITLGAKTTEWIRSWQVTKEGNWGVGDAFWEENTSMAIVSFLCLLMVETNPFLQKFFGWKGFVYLGRISFSMYLFHPTVIETIGLALKDSVPKTPFFVLVQILLVTLAVFICSDVLTKLFDEPSIHVTKWVETDLLTPWSIRRILAIPGFWMRILGNLLRSVVPFGYTKVSQETEIPQ